MQANGGRHEISIVNAPFNPFEWDFSFLPAYADEHFHEYITDAEGIIRSRWKNWTENVTQKYKKRNAKLQKYPIKFSQYQI